MAIANMLSMSSEFCRAIIARQILSWSGEAVSDCAVPAMSIPLRSADRYRYAAVRCSCHLTVDGLFYMSLTTMPHNRLFRESN